MKKHLFFSALLCFAPVSPSAFAQHPVTLHSARQEAQALVLPAPTGPYGVGKRNTQLQDPSRKETFTEEPLDLRTLPVTFYYPSTAPSTPQPWISGPWLTGMTTSSGLPAGVLSQLRGHATQDAPLAAGPFPLVILSHGMASTPQVSTLLAEELASQGFLVALVSHPYSALFAVLDSHVVYLKPEGDLLIDPAIKDPRQVFEARLEQVEKVRSVWKGDFEFLLGALPQDPFLKDHLLDGYAALVGHSFGGSSALQMSSRVQAVVNMDGGLSGDLKQYLSGTPTLTVVHDGVPRTLDTIEPELEPLRPLVETARIGNWLRIKLHRGYAAHLEFAGTLHNDFTDLGMLAHLVPALKAHPAFLLGTADPVQTHTQLNRAVVSFLRSTVAGKKPNLHTLQLKNVKVTEHR